MNLSPKVAKSNLGFSLNDIPRVDNVAGAVTKPPSKLFKLLNDKMLHSIDSIEETEKKLSSFIKTNMPEIKGITDNRMIKKEKSPSPGKFMGENYNPHNYVYNFQKSRIKRNTFGALFQH